jgi:hypothetical protein
MNKICLSLIILVCAGTVVAQPKVDLRAGLNDILQELKQEWGGISCDELTHDAEQCRAWAEVFTTLIDSERTMIGLEKQVNKPTGFYDRPSLWSLSERARLDRIRSEAFRRTDDALERACKLVLRIRNKEARERISAILVDMGKPCKQ